MSGWSGGTFTRVHNWVNDANASIGIEASRHDEEADGFAAGINSCLHKGGQNAPTADIDWGGYKLTTLGAATAASGAARLDQAQLQTSSYAAASGSANTYTLTLSPAPTSYATGMLIRFKPSASCTGASTINVNGLGAKSIKLMSGSDPYRNALHTSQIAECIYDGTNFVLMTPAKPFMGALCTAQNITMSNGTGAAISFASESYDTDAWHNTSSNTSRLTVPAGISYVRISAALEFAANSTGHRYAYIKKNGADFGPPYPTAASVGVSASYVSALSLCSVPLSVSSGDYFELFALQTSGGNLDVEIASFAIEAVL